jgi:hypothetical protein
VGSYTKDEGRGGVNLLGGRARTRHLHPQTYRELKGGFDLNRAIGAGLLPSIYFSDNLHELPAWRQSKKRKPIASSKYYFFDVGVLATLQGR